MPIPITKTLDACYRCLYTGHAYNENRLKPVVGFCGAFNTNNVHMPTTVIQFIHLIVCLTFDHVQTVPTH